ncbi:hypothetical protein GDO86_017534 [Hymenochirus boettgeri]|uniref:RING-type E3 ubiquitin transferase n=1 Tax=Hymenochirus boettgeri TaxID=247094 RepID=A0A8T2IK15_9PIPI|nr:hypothetical protein GDO86_017534 [Hymenochirus boettgeri]
MASRTGKTIDSERSCVLCCQDLDIYALGKCDHPVCYRCSTKMRVLCEQKYCAVCREELDKVVFVKKLALFSSIPFQQMQYEKKYDIYFENGQLFSQFRKLLHHECSLCPSSRPFHAFTDLEQHMRKQHELFCCKLCVKHLKNFTYERAWYTRKDLARHRMHGDPEDTSHRGHPLCKFCDERYLDNDELLKHLRRDHYFCHFCDSDGTQDYYSDYSFLREHFRESHFLCEEGRCNTEQFTHAFRSEIDYKAHKTSCHSKNRAEARQNRQIDIQFSYAPRHHNRRNEGIVSPEDYEEVDRYNRQARTARGAPRGGPQNKRGSWRYKREEEDRAVAAAVRASVAARRQEEIGRNQTQEIMETPISRKEETRDLDEGCKSKPSSKTTSDIAGPKETGKMQNASNGGLSKEDFPSVGYAATLPLSSSAKPVAAKLKEEDFPSLSSVVSASSSTSSSMPVFTGLNYTASARSGNTFQEEDFPALVTKMNAIKPISSVVSAWSTSSSKSAPKMTSHAAPSKPVKKMFPLGNAKAVGKKISKASSISDDEEDGTGMTTQEFRSAPTMFDISKLLTSPTPQNCGKVGKKKRVGSDKPHTLSAAQNLADKPANFSSSLKENASEIEHTPTPPASSILSDKSNTVANGLAEKKVPDKISNFKENPELKKVSANVQLSPLPDEEFPALMNSSVLRMPPPGFSPVTIAPLAPPPGLAKSAGNPPPGFSNVPSTSLPNSQQNKPAKGVAFCTRTYLVPENFQQRNIHLINSIKDFLSGDESKFNEFKSLSGQFRQGLISAAGYYKSCRQLLGENFKLIFNELLVLLPDNAKQQELLSAHQECGAEEKPSSNKSKKTKKTAWITDSKSLDLDYSVCSSCSQVLASRDVASHKKLHLEDHDFPSLQATNRIIS